MAPADISYEKPCVFFVTHANVVVDPAKAVPDWSLSTAGRARHERFNRHDFVSDITAIYCSAERKAVDGAEILSEGLGLPFTIRDALGENDRSSTGFPPPSEFEATADLFFAHPDESIRGWERARDAQDRIVRAVEGIVTEDTSRGHIAIIAHGGVGTLLLCHQMRVGISRVMDQPGSGGGNYFVFDRENGALVHGWRDIGSA